MFGKIFASLYKGSMIGSGPIIFSVWNYVIANMVPETYTKDKEAQKEIGMQVELNPVYLSLVIGKITSQDVEDAIRFLCSPDPRSTSPEEEGRRLLPQGGFIYKVVNGARYKAIRNEEARRKQIAEAQARYREKKRKNTNPPKQHPINGEVAYCEKQKRIAAAEDGGGM